jgi:flagellar basal-body rod modification protein FlgD
VITTIPDTAPPPTSALNTPGPGGILGKDEFLKLLVAQMRHQDPLSPMKGEELAVQLATFSSVEQLINLNETMSNQEGMQRAIVEALNGSSALSAIGKNVVALGNGVTIPEDGAVAPLQFVVGGAGGAATLRLFDSTGTEVLSQELGFTPAGRRSLEIAEMVEDLPPGNYTFSVEVVGEDGNMVPVQTFTTGRVDGVRYGSAGPVLTSGPFEIPIGGIVEILAASNPSQEQETPSE